jgi:hypothetical protein
MTLRQKLFAVAAVGAAALMAGCASTRGGGGGGGGGLDWADDNCFGSGAALYPPGYIAAYPGGYSSWNLNDLLYPCSVVTGTYYPERSLAVTRASVEPAQHRTLKPPTISRVPTYDPGPDLTSGAYASQAPAPIGRMDLAPAAAPSPATTTVKRN